MKFKKLVFAAYLMRETYNNAYIFNLIDHYFLSKSFFRVALTKSQASHFGSCLPSVSGTTFPPGD